MKYFICLRCGRMFCEGTWEEEEKEIREIRYVVGDKTYKYTEEAIKFLRKLYNRLSGITTCPACFYGVLKEIPKEEFEKRIKTKKTFKVDKFIIEMSKRMGFIEEVKNG